MVIYVYGWERIRLRPWLTFYTGDREVGEHLEQTEGWYVHLALGLSRQDEDASFVFIAVEGTYTL